MPAEIDLPKTQRWLQAFIVSPADSDEEALVSEPVLAEHAGDVAQVVTPSRTLTAAERAGIYRGMYLQRLQEALEADYPVVRDWLGEVQFVRLTGGYVRAYPSRSYTLNRLGDHLPEYIASLPDFEHQGLLRDLARFELAVTETFDEEETVPLGPEAIAQVPEDAWEDARFQPVAALRLLELEHPVDRFKEAYRDGADYPKPAAGATRVAVYRRSYRVFWLTLSPPAFELLRALIDGVPMGEAIEESVAEEEALFGWFQDWLQAGFFRGVTLPSE